MYYYMSAPVLAYNWILITAAIIPALFLMIKVYRSDQLEKERISLVARMGVAGILAALLAMVAERIGAAILDLIVPQNSVIYGLLLYFVIVAFSEEGAKYAMLKRRTWNLKDFNCQYDATVYAVFVSLGFSLWENVSYVLHYGFSTALVRAVTAIPGHACFGVFMGAFYGLARSYACIGSEGKSKFFRILSVVVPALIHGAYDFAASIQVSGGTWIFIGFIIILFGISFLLISRMSKNDRYFQNQNAIQSAGR